MNAHGNTEVFLLDVTIRDGGYVNGHTWTVEQAASVVRACRAAGVRSTEVGYLRPARHGVDSDATPSASCPPDYLDRLAEEAGDTQLTVMAHAKDVEPRDVAGLARRGVGMIRFPTRPDTVAQLRPLLDAAHAAGIGTAVNLIRVSELPEDVILRAAEAAELVAAGRFYLADSNGSMFPQDVAQLAARVRAAVDIALGFHGHDGISMAFANTLAAMASGFECIDASLAGLGKGGGNLRLELITSYLSARGRQSFSVAALMRAAGDLVTLAGGGDLRRRCESIVSGMLDLNIDALAQLRADEPEEIFALLDTAAVR
jgi:4-hydroxy 2-oxovalerate aldolase